MSNAEPSLPRRLAAYLGLEYTVPYWLSGKASAGSSSGFSLTIHTSLLGLKSGGYISELVEDLLRRLGQGALNNEVIESLSKALPGLLGTLALKLGHGAQSQMRPDVIFFLDTHRR